MHILLVILFLYSFSAHNFPQGSVLLVGGGGENYGDWSDIPYRWLVEHAPNRKILVLHYSDTTTWFSGYFPSLSPCTVSNRFISTTTQANDSATYQFILQHDGIFLRGGDQAQYVVRWKNTLTQKAIKEVFQRGGVVGGTSAGEMVLTNVSYTSGSSDNGSLLRVPTSSISLIDDFLPLVPNALAESHTNERGRIGRTPVFLARYKNLTGHEVTGIAVDVNTALSIGTDGVGEVMGGSAVALLRWTSNTSYLIEAGKPFSMQNMKFDQLLPGYKINLLTNEITVPPSAVAFNPKAVIFPNGPVLLDGSGNISDWSNATGSFKKLQSLLSNTTDTIGIFSSPKSSTTANSIKSVFNNWGLNSHILFIDNAHKNDLLMTQETGKCRAFVFAGNALDSLAGFLDPSTTVGDIFATKVAGGNPMLFLSEDVMLAGEKAIGGLYSSKYSAYYGTLTQLSGLNLLKGIQLVPRFYQNQDNTRSYDYSENRIMGMFWSMGKSQLPYGMLIDAGAYTVLYNNQIEVGGVSASSTPVLLFDFRNGNKVDFPTFHDPGKPKAVQNSAIIGATLQVIRTGDSYLITDIINDISPASKTFFLEQNYPNPFNPATRIRYTIPEHGRVTIKIFDMLGKEISVLVDEVVETGIYETVWNASGNASGIYIARVEQFVNGSIKSQSIKLVLIK